MCVRRSCPLRLPIATYGRKDCFLAVLVILVAAALFGVGARGLGQPLLLVPSGLLVGLAIFWTSFYRDFERTIPSGDGIVLSPADGRVTDIVEVEEKNYLGGRAL